MLKKFLQGIVIGVANIIPGVSGGTMMVAMGIYDKLIHYSSSQLFRLLNFPLSQSVHKQHFYLLLQ